MIKKVLAITKIFNTSGIHSIVKYLLIKMYYLCIIYNFKCEWHHGSIPVWPDIELVTHLPGPFFGPLIGSICKTLLHIKGTIQFLKQTIYHFAPYLCWLTRSSNFSFVVIADHVSLKARGMGDKFCWISLYVTNECAFVHVINGLYGRLVHMLAYSHKNKDKKSYGSLGLLFLGP